MQQNEIVPAAKKDQAVRIAFVRLGAEDTLLGLHVAGNVPVAPGAPQSVHRARTAPQSPSRAAGSEAGAEDCSFTRSFSSLLGLKYGTRLAGTSTRAPVLGLRPMRDWRCRVRKLPKPRISILSSARRALTTESKIASTMISDSLRVNSTTRETSSIRSALVMGRGSVPLFFDA